MIVRIERADQPEEVGEATGVKVVLVTGAAIGYISWTDRQSTPIEFSDLKRITMEFPHHH